MNRYFYFPEEKRTLAIGIKDGTPTAKATPKQIKNHFKMKGEVIEIDSTEYAKLTINEKRVQHE